MTLPHVPEKVHTSGNQQSDPTNGVTILKNELESHEEVTDLTTTTSQLERKLVRKLDLHLVTLVSCLELLSFLDRSNIGNARTAGLEEDLHLDSNRYDWLLTIFYIAYLLFAFGTLGWKIFPPHRWAAFVVFGWGVAATAQAATTSWSGMMACRFFMGAFEQCFGPGVMFFFSYFYVRREIGLRCGLFIAAAPLASCFAGALAYGITSGHAALAPWRLLFLVEGLPTALMAFVVFFALPDNTQKAWFLNDAEKRLALARGIRQSGQAEPVGASAFSPREILQTFADSRAWLMALISFSLNVSFASLPVFLPTILKELGFSGVNAQGLSAPPYFLSCIITLVTCWVADKTQQRGYVVMASASLGGIGYTMLLASKSVGVRYAGVYVAVAGIFPARANLISWVINNQGSDSRRGAGMVMLNFVGQAGAFLGTRAYPRSEGPYYVKGHSVCAAFLFFAALLVISLRFYHVRLNKKLDEQYGTLEEQDACTAAERGVEGSVVGQVAENYGPRFRFVL